MTTFSKGTHSGQIFCRFPVKIDSLVETKKHGLRSVADVVTMIRRIVTFCNLKNAKSASCLFLSLLLLQRPISKPAFEKNLLFTALKISDFFSDSELIEKPLF